MLRAYHALALAAALILAQCFADWADSQEPVYVPVKQNVWRMR